MGHMIKKIYRFSQVQKRSSWAGLFKARLRQPRLSENFDLNFVTLQGGFLDIVWPSVLSLNNLKIHKTKAVKSICLK